MRIIGEIDHPTLKITVFKMNDKVSIKFEQNLIEQIFKFRDGAGIHTLEDAEKWANASILSEIEANFHAMNKARYDALESMMKAQGEEFPTII